MITKETAKLIGIFIGLFVVIVMVSLLTRWARTDKDSKCQYDERQQLVRGKGFKFAYFTALIGMAVFIALHDETDKYISSSVFVTIVLIISVAVYAIYCIVQNGYIALNTNPKRELILFAFIGIVNTWTGIMATIDSKPVMTESIPDGILNLCCAALMWVVFFALLIKTIFDKFSKEEEE